jgi:hypothetical protein
MLTQKQFSLLPNLHENFSVLWSSPTNIAWDYLDAKFKAHFAGLKNAHQQIELVEKFCVTSTVECNIT